MPILQAGVMRKLLTPSESISTFCILQSVLVPELLLLDSMHSVGCSLHWRVAVYRLVINTGYAQRNGAVSKVNKKFISHLTRAQRTPLAAATVQVFHALITVLNCMHPGSHDTHPHGNQIHPRLVVACPL